MSRIQMAQLGLRNHVDQIGRYHLFLKCGLFSILNIVLFSVLFNSTHNTTFDLSLIASMFVYFIPLVSLTATVSSFESELFASIGEYLLLSPNVVFWSRMLVLSVEILPTILFFFILFFVTHANIASYFLLAGLVISFISLGLGIGYCFGFKTEKSINNFSHLFVWILGIGPGPFQGNEPHWYQIIFPIENAYHLTSDFEWIKVLVYTLIGCTLIWFGRYPRRERLFTK